jgi:hypothetical protein
VMHGNAGSFVVLSQETHGLAGADDFADCPSCDMLDWSHSQQVDDLMSLFVEASPFLGIYSEMAEVPTCPVEDWSSEQEQADLINLLLQVLARAMSIPVPICLRVPGMRLEHQIPKVDWQSLFLIQQS